MNPILALDGHDGSGKTTLAQRLAEKLGGCYVRPYCAPHGPELLTAAEAQQYERLTATARTARQEAIEAAQAAPGQPLIFDRLWITLFTLLPKEHRKSWLFRPPTAICWADWETTEARLKHRRETDPHSAARHQHYIQQYAEFAKIYDCFLVDTSACEEDEALERLRVWAEHLLTKQETS